MRIRKHIEEINGRKHSQKTDHEPVQQKGGLNVDQGMTEAQSRASSMIKTRAREMRRDAGGSGNGPIEMPVLQNNLYKLDAWVQPFADAQDIHSQVLRENRDHFHTYMSDLQKQLKRHKLHVNTNELVKRVQA